MIHDPEYVKELIRKRLDDTITDVEDVRLEFARKIYEADEFADMVADVLLDMEGQLPDDPLRHWRPDFERITTTAEQEIRRRDTLRQYIQIGVAAAVSAVVLTIGYMVRRQDMHAPLLIGDCTGIPEGMEIPSSESAGTLLGSGIQALHIAASDSEAIARVGHVAVDKTEDGIVRITHLSGIAPSDGYIALTTAVRQQCVVELPDGTRIRLNARSALLYNPATQPDGSPVIRFTGEAHVQVAAPASTGEKPFIMETSNSRLVAAEGDFVVRTDRGQTHTMLLDGRMTAETLTGKHRQSLDCPGDVAVILHTAQGGGDDLQFYRDGPISAALSWTKAKRTYRNVPLRQFVLEASRWHGFQIEDINCIPADRRINATLCYRARKTELFAAIHTAGVTVYEKDGMLSFCKEGTKRRISMVSANRLQFWQQLCTVCR